MRQVIKHKMIKFAGASISAADQTPPIMQHAVEQDTDSSTCPVLSRARTAPGVLANRLHARTVSRCCLHLSQPATVCRTP
jgi:hypothetical protein